jgi:folate-binding protein YgfZ
MYAHLQSRSVIEISGDDRLTFINGLITIDVNLLKTQDMIFGAFLTPQGKFLYDLFLFEDADKEVLYVDVESQYVDVFIKRLSIFKLKSRVNIASADLNVYGRLNDTEVASPTLKILDPRHPKMGYRIYSNSVLRSDAFAFKLWDKNRIMCTIPDATRDIPYERGFIMEYGFDDMHGISWDKGCYLGQELTARMKYRNLSKKKLVTLESLDGVILSSDEEDVFQNGEKIGVLKSTNDTFALALLDMDSLNSEHPIMSQNKQFRLFQQL